MTDLVVVTALLGSGPDQLGPPPPVVDGVRYVCVTDRSDALPAGWQRYSYTGPPGSSRLQARWVRASVVMDYPEPWSLWLDASFDLLVSPRLFVEECLRHDVEMLAFAHPDRCRMRDEAAEIVRLGQIHADEALLFMASAHALLGWDTDEHPQTVLTAGGMLVRRATNTTRAFGVRWWEEIATWGERFDQLSLDYCAAQVGMTIGHLTEHYAKHPWLRYDWARHRGVVAR